jgi:hypothetical protein
MTVIRRLKKTTSAVMRGIGLAGPIKVSKTKTASMPVAFDTALEGKHIEIPEPKKAVEVPSSAPVQNPSDTASAPFRLFESPKPGERPLRGVPVLAHDAATW